MKKLFGLFIATILLVTTANAQVGLTTQSLAQSGNTWFISGNQVDTLVKSTTVFWVAPANSYTTSQTVSFTVAVDSVAGTPNMTFQPYVSNDKVHWAPVGSAVVFNSAKNYWHTSSTVPGKSDSTVTVNTNPWTGQWIGIKGTTNSNTQRGVYYIYIKASNTY